MQRRLLVFAIIGIILFIAIIGLIFFKVQERNNIILENNNINQNNYRATMTIKDGTLNKDGAIIVIKNNDEKTLGYDEWFRIDKEKNKKWEELKAKNNYIFYSLAYIIEGKKETEIKVEWSKLYGELKAGRYRLVKHFNDNEYLTTEFVIF